MQQKPLHDVRKWSVTVAICHWLWWLIIPAFLAWIFQIVLIVKSAHLDSNERNKTLYLVLSIIGLFIFGDIVDIVIAASSRYDLKHQSVNYSPIQNITINN